ncbi:TPA: DNA sulfur modification protein DndE [Vibrio parahaemolyticus]|uniref:DNA sulfur modification protein DndE n=1 Tax=Vibrio parahaemolyticus TaxID=670 RepID=UPI00193FBFB5|nr:DNA sulfur modification protein DndE [Vibrio parahaemolyticus]EGQ7686068.1 DNA sulfur modification protein DndE [Vibrio parahaemolyticus]EGQ8186115.1 DNA sulfur modification protein DndE [Vibrio parahaemolyticus]EGQ8542313.1 DNA sulfur modification protein DndE [Vibrio parahaemolyticus]EHH1030023.1 DNA sulfur modification protein DndE [Vibrio parahaemolyticus]EJG0663119.1 DNA sulfur modification protein DndE [Vibrio parahaemolyticus]
MSIETVRLSEKAKGQLITVKKNTKIDNWNVLCRWALMLSLKEESIPPHEDIVTNSNVEMTWKVFGGEFSDIYLAMLRQRIKSDFRKIDEDELNYHFKLHLHRGISYLLQKSKDIDSLLNIAI